MRGNHDPPWTARDQRRRETSELGRERDERAEDLEIGGLDDRDVHRRLDELALEGGGDLLGDDQPRSILGLRGRAGEMRGHDDVLELEERAGVRLLLEDVESRPGDLPGADGVRERLLVDQPAASRVDDADTVPHPRERCLVEQPPRLLVERKVERDQVGLAIDVLGRRRGLDPELAEPVERHVRVVRDDAEPQPQRPPCDLTPDAPQAEDAERLPRQLDAREAPSVPRPLLERSVGLGDVPGDGEEQRERVLGGRHHRRLGRVRHDDAPPRRRVHVDVVDADACTPDHLEASRLLDEPRVDRRPRPHDDRVEVGDDRLELRAAVLDDFEAPAEELEPRLGDRLPDENPRSLRDLRHGLRRGTPRARSRPRLPARRPPRSRRGAAPPRRARS